MAKKSTDLRTKALQGVPVDVRSSSDEEREWQVDRETPAIPSIPVPGPRRSDDSRRVPVQPHRDLSGAVAA